MVNTSKRNRYTLYPSIKTRKRIKYVGIVPTNRSTVENFIKRRPKYF